MLKRKPKNRLFFGAADTLVKVQGINTERPRLYYFQKTASRAAPPLVIGIRIEIPLVFLGFPWSWTIDWHINDIYGRG